MIALMNRRFTTAAAIAAGAALVLTGCSAGQHTQTSTQAPAINGASADWTKEGGDPNTPTLHLRDVRVLLPRVIEAGDTTNLKGGDAALGFTIINSDATVSYTLTEITATSHDGTELGTAEVEDGEIKPGHGLIAPEDVAHADNLSPVAAELSGLKGDICPGPRVSLVFTFESSTGSDAKVTVETPVDAGVVDRADRYADDASRRDDTGSVDSTNCLGS